MYVQLQVLVGHPSYEVTDGTAKFREKDLWELAPEERSHEGLFLSFQSPIEVPGVRCVARNTCPIRHPVMDIFSPLLVWTDSCSVILCAKFITVISQIDDMLIVLPAEYAETDASGPLHDDWSFNLYANSHVPGLVRKCGLGMVVRRPRELL